MARQRVKTPFIRVNSLGIDSSPFLSLSSSDCRESNVIILQDMQHSLCCNIEKDFIYDDVTFQGSYRGM